VLVEQERVAVRVGHHEVRRTLGLLVMEKDFYLTRLIWAFAQELGDQMLLKGGTLLSKVDLGFFRCRKTPILSCLERRADFERQMSRGWSASALR
jgi:hypothetical protein